MPRKLQFAAAVALAVIITTPPGRAQRDDAKSGLATASATVARNVVLVHGLFADGSSWSEVIARLQAAGLNATAVQNPLTTLPEAVASVKRVLARQDGPTVLVGHSFAGMIVTEAGTDPKVSALVYVAARAPDAGEDYTALAKTFPATRVRRHPLRRRRRPAERGRLLAGFRGRPARSEGEGALCSPGAVQQGSAHGQDHAGSLAVKAEFLRHLD
jgi:pimeloyl-ACP methyl ester carboxylesterase